MINPGLSLAYLTVPSFSYFPDLAETLYYVQLTLHIFLISTFFFYVFLKRRPIFLLINQNIFPVKGKQMIKYQATLQTDSPHIEHETGKRDVYVLGVGWSDEGTVIKIKVLKIPVNL